jgi:hypothetical protein
LCRYGMPDATYGQAWVEAAGRGGQQRAPSLSVQKDWVASETPDGGWQ